MIKKKLSAWTERQVKSDETGKLHKGYDNDHPVGAFSLLVWMWVCVWQVICRLWRRVSSGIWWRRCLQRWFSVKIVQCRRWIRILGTAESCVVCAGHWGFCVTLCPLIICWWQMHRSWINCLRFSRLIFSFLLLKEKIRPAQAACVALAFIGCLFVVKPGFQNAALVPALIGVCGGLGAGIAYTMVRVLGTHGVKGPVIVFIFHFSPACRLYPGCCSISHPWVWSSLWHCWWQDYSQRADSFTITAAYTYAPAGKISIFDYSQIILPRCWDLSCLERFRISTALQDMCWLFWHHWVPFFIIWG